MIKIISLSHFKSCQTLYEVEKLIKEDKLINSKQFAY